MKIKKVLWEDSMYDHALLIDPEEIAEEVHLWTDGRIFEISGGSLDALHDAEKQIIAKLKEKEDLDELTIRYMDADELEGVLNEMGFEGVSVSMADEWIAPDKNVLLFDAGESMFWKPAQLETTKTYQWWDGSNWRKVVLESHMNEKVVEITSASVCFDEWDGYGWQTGGNGLHQYIHKILTIDGETEEDSYLLVYSSQWQGHHDRAAVLSIGEVREHLKQLERDVEKYMYEVGTLSGK
ncbi:hypothetical protein GFC29_3829 (plasmid) [Anoxybacillus sp. B7M1]|uniref:hypothetical protein n=1 Tax=Anoxybacillus sp. B7M1 TaxID=1490057 RepID=UPI0005CCE148|nr:hypothetical protein [Anoxybacillus sp. B7M1]ANB66159.1 hypothetical protein GFC29_3829 [Anoxybacillus sp. B7M1]